MCVCVNYTYSHMILQNNLVHDIANNRCDEFVVFNISVTTLGYLTMFLQ